MTIFRSIYIGTQASLFTAVNYNLYQPPPGFCFDIYCNDEPIIDDPKSKDYNVDRRVCLILNKYVCVIRLFSNQILFIGNWIPQLLPRTKKFVCDRFHYVDNGEWFSLSRRQRLVQEHGQTYKVLLGFRSGLRRNCAQVTIPKLTNKLQIELYRYANERQATGSRFNLFYSTPSCYIKALHDHSVSWPSKKDDFFPYGSDAHAYWTGYFTSRPTSKYMIRQGSNLLQVITSNI